MIAILAVAMIELLLAVVAILLGVHKMIGADSK
jgi:hypothetical protein